jgi:hypothetical protein
VNTIGNLCSSIASHLTEHEVTSGPVGVVDRLELGHQSGGHFVKVGGDAYHR